MPNYKKISNNIHQVIIDNPKTVKEKLIWINIKNAGKKEIEFLRKKFNFRLSHLQASSVKTTAQRPIIEQAEEYLFMILHFPVFENGKIISGEIDFFIGPGFLITLHDNNIKELNDFFNLYKKDGDSHLGYEFESSSLLLYELLEKLILSCHALLDQNSLAINEIEKLIFANQQKKAVSKILTLRLGITIFRKIMQNHKNIIKKLMVRESRFATPETIKKHYVQLIEHSKRLWENLENQKESIDILNNTNESLLNYKISDIMKTLTIFSVIVFPLTLFAAVFGMNTTGGMPFLDTENGFWVIISFMLLGCLGMIIFFSKKKWL
ncbi:MAG: magnesium transporter CorA family protein [Patescibacteria group bacterium]|nr:magnesium transporter CorA family protein [Patescibacteria group bacterium]